MSASLRLPRVVVTAAAAEYLVALLPAADEYATVEVLARAVAHSSESFAEELAQRLFAKGYRHLRLRGASRELNTQLSGAARRTGLSFTSSTPPATSTPLQKSVRLARAAKERVLYYPRLRKR
jgi:hypothetical protein